MFFKSLSITFLSLVLTTTTYSENRPTEPDWTRVVQDQNAMDSLLVQSLNSDRSDTQARALIALAKIMTNSSLSLLVDAQDKIAPQNLDTYCFALGQMYLVSSERIGETPDVEKKNQALLLLEQLVQAKKSIGFCFEAFAKLAPRSADIQMETLFMQIDFANLHAADTARAILGIFFHRGTTFDAANPTDRYFFTDTLKPFFRAQGFAQHPDAQVRQAYARTAYLAKDDLVFGEYSDLLNDSDFMVRYLATDLVNFVDKKNAAPIYSMLRDQDYRIVVRALENLKTLGQSEDLLKQHSYLLTHSRHQVRRAMVQAVLEKLSLEEVKALLKDSSLAVKQIGAKEYTVRADDRYQFAQTIFRDGDLAFKKGVIDASESLGDKRVEILQQAMKDADFFVKAYAVSHIQENSIQLLYPQMIELLGAPTFEERYEAIAVLMKWVDCPERSQLILSVYKASQAPMFWYARELIVGQLIASENPADHQLLLQLLPLEQNWRIANQIGAGMKKHSLGEFVVRQPEWSDAAGSQYKVAERRPQIEMITTKGTMVFELYNDMAPLHISEVLWGIEQGFWSQNFFHRVIDNFVAQAYRPVNVTHVPNADVRAEILGQMQERGTLAMPRSDYLHSGDGGGFYINLITNFNLNNNYTVFGKLISGDPVLDEIEIGDQVLSVKRIK